MSVFQNANSAFVLRLVLAFSTFLYSFSQVVAQSSVPLNMQNLASVKVDDLTDEQILTFWKEAKRNGIDKAQLELQARDRRMPEAQIQKLLERIEKIEKDLLAKKDKSAENEDRNREKDKDGRTKKTEPNKEETEEDKKLREDKELMELFEGLKTKVFGMDLFNNKNITFEPDLKIPTPTNYQLGPGDELLIDIYGYSEATINSKVSPDGNVRIPSVGLINVSGMTIENARKKIINQLSSVYSGILNGQTQVSITLGNIRSIKVILLGEVNTPGTYTLPSLATVFNALYVSGGPSENGSFRDITVIRGGKNIATVDIYEFLINGSAKSNIRLQDQDIIKVNPYTTRVELKGNVKRSAYFDVKKGETFKDVLAFAGGFTDKAFTGKVKVIRNTKNQKSVADINSDLYGMFIPQNGDVYHIGQLLDRFENRVMVEGAVFRPGEYALDNDLTVKKLIEKAEGLTEDAFLTRAIIYRLKDDNSLEMVSFDLSELLSGKATDIKLKREDKLIIASKLEMREEYRVKITGEVLKPGDYDFAERMKLQDLIIAAGGLKESASIKRIEVGRRSDSADRKSEITNIAKVFSIDVEKDLKEHPELGTFELKPFDIVTVFPNPNYIKQSIVKVTGQVMFPGDFVISKNRERISEVIKRAGGLTNEAFDEGAILVRERTATINQRIITLNKTRALKKLAKDDDAEKDIKSEEFANKTDLVAIDLKKIMKNPGGKEDIIVTAGDIINVPKQQQTVLTSGEVLFPVKIVYQKGLSFKDYVSGSGGYTTLALKRKAYIVYANGSAKSTKNFLLFKVHPKVKPGAEIIIPPKEKKQSLSTAETVSILTSTTTIVILIISLFR